MNAPDEEPLDYIVVKLRDTEATLDGALRWIDRHMNDRPELRRIELRYPNLGDRSIVQAVASAKIIALCREKGGYGSVKVSPRFHELPLDQASKHLTVRLGFAAAAPLGAKSSTLGSWWSRFIALFGSASASDPDNAPNAGDESHPLSEQAVATLLEGLDQAVAIYKTQKDAQAVRAVIITVTTQGLNQTLSPKMPPHDTANACKWLGLELEERGLKIDAGLEVKYVFNDPLSGSTIPVGDADLSVRLSSQALSTAGVGPDAKAPHPATHGAGPTPMPQPNGTTPLPQSSAAVVGPTLVLHVLGTWQNGALVPLKQPFECGLGPVPAQFSRSTLEMNGFSERPDAALARAASNSTPLGFSRHADHGIKLHAAHRPDSSLAMYFFAADLSPCIGEHPFQAPVRLIVNGPEPLQDGIFPLVIEVRLK